MRASALSKIVVLAAAAGPAASISNTAQARMMKAPPGSCVIDRKIIVASGVFCSHQCDPSTQWCQQGWCLNAQWTPVISCYGPVCSAKCGGH
jgi:hypothetical protein